MSLSALASAHTKQVGIRQPGAEGHMAWQPSRKEDISRHHIAQVSRFESDLFLDCDPACDECVSNGAGYCTSCAKGKYLRIADATKSYGTCETQTTPPIAQIYFVLSSASDSLLNDGTYTNPLKYLEDALEKAHEYCALYTSGCEVSIKLMKGTHYILRGGNRDPYFPTSQSRDS